VTAPPAPSTRLHVLLARHAPFAVIFRRGPSKQVLTIGWNTQGHKFRMGQWFRGRIYERRCDLSPSGDKLLYFAAKWRDPHQTWTALSRAPFLTALLLWPKGDAWGGGGLFQTERAIQLNHEKNRRVLADGKRLPRWMRVDAFEPVPGRGEDDPIWSTRMKRDGWELKQAGTAKENKRGAQLSWEFPRNVVWSKTRGNWSLVLRILGIHERDGPWYVIEHEIADASGTIVHSLGRSDWADWSQSGEILYAKQGRLWRIRIKGADQLGEAEELIDLRGLRFEQVIPPEEALIWDADPPQGKRLL
jgi:hypothetical protein